ncbi:MAG: type I restriction enzyme HsdR N-terminal domain-containing protein [Ferruginibacter sp.]|nr:type I restriction enzyme HsdR N-terminal domain-containing protein [Cytophagales bacterium]
MIALNLPEFAYKLREIEDKLYIFDILRRKYVFLTPEEWVRQHFVHFLIDQHGYPKALMKNEGGLRYNRLTKRTDIVIYDRHGESFLVVECKGANVPLSQSTFDQAAQYNHTLKAPYLAVTNGLAFHCVRIHHVEQRFAFLPGIPPYEG